MSSDNNLTQNEDTAKPMDDGETFQNAINIDFTAMIQTMTALKKQINAIKKEVEVTEKK